MRSNATQEFLEHLVTIGGETKAYGTWMAELEAIASSQGHDRQKAIQLANLYMGALEMRRS